MGGRRCCFGGTREKSEVSCCCWGYRCRVVWDGDLTNDHQQKLVLASYITVSCQEIGMKMKMKTDHFPMFLRLHFTFFFSSYSILFRLLPFLSPLHSFHKFSVFQHIHSVVFGGRGDKRVAKVSENVSEITRNGPNARQKRGKNYNQKC